MASVDSVLDDEAAVLQALTGYYSAFSTLEVRAILPFFHEPSMLIGPPGVFAAATHAELAGAFTPLIEGLRARQYARSELSVQSTTSLSGTTRMVTGVAIRYRLDGHELERAGVTYVLHKGGAGWKIAVLIIHDADQT